MDPMRFPGRQPVGPDRRFMRRRLMVAIGAVLVVVTIFALAAPSCGGDGAAPAEPETTTSTVPTTEPPTTASSAPPATGGEGAPPSTAPPADPTATLPAPAGTDPLDAPLADVDATGRALVNRFAEILASPDPRPRLEEFLSPAFQLQRANGTFANRDEYLAQPPTVTRFDIVNDNFRATQDGRVLTVRLRVDVTEPGGAGPTSADRLGVFVRSAEGWRLAAWANFNAVEQ